MSSLIDKIVGFFTGTSPEAESERFGEGIIDDDEIRNLSDLDHHYPLPPGYKYATDLNNRPMVVREEDNASASFLVESGLLTFHEPAPHQVDEDESNVIEVPKRAAPPM